MQQKGGFRDLKVYKKAFLLAMVIFEESKNFPMGERFALTDQLRRSSRSVCRAIGEGYRKRQYPKHFRNKISDADMENTETQISLDFARSCGYLSKEKHLELMQKSIEIGKMINHMIAYPEKYSPRSYGKS